LSSSIVVVVRRDQPQPRTAALGREPLDLGDERGAIEGDFDDSTPSDP
jgi:hypothetical protein